MILFKILWLFELLNFVSNQETAIFQTQWFFWTKKCQIQFRTTMDVFNDCISKVSGDNCVDFANSASKCYNPVEGFECPDRVVQNQVRLIGRREKNIQNLILCKMPPKDRALCLSKVNPVYCRPGADNTLNDICSISSETNQCIFKTIDENCSPEHINATKKYIQVVTDEVICKGYVPSSVPRLLLSPLLLFVSIFIVR